MWSTLTTLAGSVVGKIVIGASVVLAATSGAHAAGVIDVPVLPESQNEAAVETADARDDSPSTSSTSTSTTSTVPAAGDASAGDAPSGTSTHVVLDAGSVTISVDGTSVSVVTADPNDGWRAEIETDELDEAEVNFRDGDDRVDFRAEIEDGQLRVRIRDRRVDTETENFVDADGNSVSESTDAGDAPSGTSTHAVLDAGSVTISVDGTSVSVVTADPNDGWRAEIETGEPHEAEVNFRDGDDRVDFRAEIEDGQLRVRIRDRRVDTEIETFVDADGNSVSESTDDADDSDDDGSGSNSGSSHDDSNDDRSGSNSGSSHDDSNDDRSGSNSGSSHDDDDDADDGA